MHAENLDSFLYGMRSTPSFRTHLISEQNEYWSILCRKEIFPIKGNKCGVSLVEWEFLILKYTGRSCRFAIFSNNIQLRHFVLLIKGYPRFFLRYSCIKWVKNIHATTTRLVCNDSLLQIPTVSPVFRNCCQCFCSQAFH